MQTTILQYRVITIKQKHAQSRLAEQRRKINNICRGSRKFTEKGNIRAGILKTSRSLPDGRKFISDTTREYAKAWRLKYNLIFGELLCSWGLRARNTHVY